MFVFSGRYRIQKLKQLVRLGLRRNINQWFVHLNSCSLRCNRGEVRCNNHIAVVSNNRSRLFLKIEIPNSWDLYWFNLIISVRLGPPPPLSCKSKLHRQPSLHQRKAFCLPPVTTFHYTRNEHIYRSNDEIHAILWDRFGKANRVSLGWDRLA